MSIQTIYQGFPLVFQSSPETLSSSATQCSDEYCTWKGKQTLINFIDIYWNLCKKYLTSKHSEMISKITNLSDASLRDKLFNMTICPISIISVVAISTRTQLMFVFLHIHFWLQKQKKIKILFVNLMVLLSDTTLSHEVTPISW